MIGQTISHYQIKRELGRGGMGVVYLADDLRLGRQVAIKALPSELSRDPLRRKRFEQEARACAVLNHASIASVFDLEEAGDELFIVFEYVDGEDLRAQLQRGALATSQLLKLARGIGCGLAAAHQAGIIHRDLKPENIRVNSAGEVKILDFGLARMQPELLNSAATFSFALTQQGHIVGTVGYMSPEQLESRELDARSDVFSFGVILYEMAAGVHPFQGESPASTIANVLTKDPAPVEHLNPVQPPALDRIVRKCLAKKKEQRYQSVADLLLDLEDVERKSGDTMKTVVIAPATATLPSAASDSLFVGLVARVFPNMRRWWELHHLFMAVAILAIFPYLAWQVRGSLGGQLDLLFFFSVVILTMVHFVFRGGMLLGVTFHPAKQVETIQRLGTVTRLTHIVLCLAVVLAAPKFVAEHPLLGTFFAAMVIGGIFVSVFIEPWMESGAFPELARLREELRAKDESSPNRGARQWWLIHHISSMLVWTPMMAVLPWLVRAWLPQRNNLADLIVLFSVALALQNFGMRAYILEVAWFHREALEATVRKMATPLLVCNFGLALLAAVTSAFLFQAHFAPAVGFMVMAVGAVMIVGILERSFNGYAFPALQDAQGAGPAAHHLDDLTLLAVMQLLYLAPLVYLLAQFVPTMEAILPWVIAQRRAQDPEFVVLALECMATIAALLFLTASSWGLMQRRMDVVRTFKRWFVLFAIFDLIAIQGVTLFLARFTPLFVLLVGATAMLYGIRYQWLLAKRILPAEAAAAHKPAPLTPAPKWNDNSRLTLLWFLYGASALWASLQTGPRADRFIQWMATPQGDTAPMIYGTIFILTSIAALFLFALAYNLFRGRPGVVSFFQRAFAFFAVLEVIALIGLVKLLDPHLTLLGAAVGAGLDGIRYQWLLAKRILADEASVAKSASAG